MDREATDPSLWKCSGSAGLPMPRLLSHGVVKYEYHV